MTKKTKLDNKEEYVTVTFYEDEIKLPPLNDEEIIIYD